MYSLCGVIGILVAGGLFCHLLVKRGQSDSEGIYLILWACLGCALGGSLLYGLTNISKWGTLIEADSIEEFLLTAGRLFGGSVFYGGLMGGLASTAIYMKVKGLRVAEYADCGAVCIPLFHAFARVGCFFAGCCYGIECSWGFASSANAYIPAVVGVSRFPTQLLEATLNLGIFVLLLVMERKGRLRGALLWFYLLLYSIVRFGVEFLRGDDLRGIWFGVSTSQWISIVLLLASTIVLATVMKRRAKTTT